MSLGSWGRFLVLIAGASLVVVAILVVACFVGPGCWGFEYLHKKENKKRQKSLERIQWPNSSNSKRKSGYSWFQNNDFTVYEVGSSGFEAKISVINETLLHQSKERVFNFQCLPLLVAPDLSSTARSSNPKLEIKLFFSSLSNVEGRLTVNIISASCLPCREYVATLDPFVTLEILNNKWSLQKNERIVHTAHTKVIKSSLNPIFDESFIFNVKKVDIKNLYLRFTISDKDALTKTTPLFEKRIHLKDVENSTTNDHIYFNLEMQEVTSNMGALYFGISYLPTAQRLNINVVKAAKLKYRHSVQSLIEFYPYVRVVMVNNHGKCIKKKKTCFRHKDDNPVFNHSLVFDLSISNLEQAVLLVLLCTKALTQMAEESWFGDKMFRLYDTDPEYETMVKTKNYFKAAFSCSTLIIITADDCVPKQWKICPGNSDDSSIEGEIETSLKESKDEVLGTIVLGRNVRCTRARDHWVSVMQNPRKMISVWHDLR